MAPHSTIPAGRIPQSEKPDSPWGRKEQNIRLSLSKNCRYCFLTFTVAREKSEVRLLSFYKWLVFSGVLVDFFSLPFLIKKKNQQDISRYCFLFTKTEWHPASLFYLQIQFLNSEYFSPVSSLITVSASPRNVILISQSRIFWSTVVKCSACQIPSIFQRKMRQFTFSRVPACFCL